MPDSLLKLLLVEDSIHDVELTLLTLENAGLSIEPVVVHNHTGAEHALRQQVFSVIICDYLLPSSSGLQVLQVAKTYAPGTPFIFLSGVLNGQNSTDTSRHGATDYVLKHNLKMLPKVIWRAVTEVKEREQRILAESELEEVRDRAKLAIEAAEMGVWELNLGTQQVIWDDRCKELYEWTPGSSLALEEILKQTYPADAFLLSYKIQQAISQESTFTAEYRIQLPSNQFRWLLSSGRSIFKDGQCVRFSGVLQDISERKEATQTLLRLNEALGERVQQRTRERDRTWELSRELLAVLSTDMTPVAFNPAWQTTLGWSSEEISRNTLQVLIHPDDLTTTILEIRKVTMGTVSTRFENRMQHANGEYRWLSWTIVPEDGLMYAAVRDMTEERTVMHQLGMMNQRLVEQIEERKRVEEALNQMQRLEVVGQLTAGLAHDFNNLLTIVLTSTSLADSALKKGNYDRVSARHRNIQEAGERGAKLTAQLLSFARRQRLDPKSIDLNATIRGMRDLLHKALGATVWYESRLADDLWTVSADPTQTEMIILNLAINARDAMPDGGALMLRTFNEEVVQTPLRPEDPEPGKYVVFALSDSGSGMTSEIRDKVFEPFFTTKEVGKGSGLGLAQVFGFAKQSGGGVQIETEVGEGTTVSVYFPIAEQAEMLGGSLIPLSTDSGPKTVLLVDDDEAVREVTQLLLSSFGHHVLTSNGGHDALSKLTSDIDIVVTDYSMPGMTGSDLALELYTRNPELPVIVITGFADIADVGLGTLKVLQKPFSNQALQQAISVALQAPSSF
ncbi:hybrid sensor histidine kinase/response regulator [Pseudomonas coleopterorum]|uniref:hybrid sensor histidine kinase/response regulator n=1 Tax=Pseudomonas coleopterorum TaxID=1605838 RepID=UPI000894963C|nr:hybrid sensor histidine kinase/response regulator [Pseudomonas coleopterorum]SEE73357.1 PAS domain S-box-containing protein [Pseudomonas coleopterorum]